MQIRDGKYLTYCTNIHPGESWEDTFESLINYTLKVKAEVSPKASFGIGLRLSNQAAGELLSQNNLELFDTWLGQNDCKIVTVNGFPYGQFHHEKVKENVHKPDWFTSERKVYTENLIKILNRLKNTSNEVGISTSPIGYKFNYESVDIKSVKKYAAISFIDLAEQLLSIESMTKKHVHIDIEPEPDGIIENSDELIAFFENELKSEATKRGKAIVDSFKRYITICFDVCHFAVEFEDISNSISKFKNSGIKIGKVQLSSAIRILPDEERKYDLKLLDEFIESTYLHQVVMMRKNGELIKLNDLYLLKLLNSAVLNQISEIRSHFHVPLFIEKYLKIESTQQYVTQMLNQFDNIECLHWEIETYTWEVLPKNLKLPISESIARELKWCLALIK